MTKPSVLFLGPLNKDLPAYRAFSAKYDCIDYTITTKEQLIKDFETKFKNIEAVYGSWLGFVPVGGFCNEVLAKAPVNLKVISICSVGIDCYDPQGMRERNIVLTNVPATSAAVPVADMVLFNTLASFRNFHIVQQTFVNDFPLTYDARAATQYSDFNRQTGRLELQGSIDEYAYGQYVGRKLDNHNPKGHHAVVIGFGQIGKLIGSRLANIGMHVHYIKRTPLTEQEEKDLGYEASFEKSVDDVTDFADLIVIAAPATPETKDMINKDIINKFVNPIRIINVGRGTIIDEDALVDGLQTGKVVFAGLDVFRDEPKVHPGLLNRHDVFLTPHIGASTVENFDNTAIQAMENIDSILSGGQGINRIN